MKSSSEERLLIDDNKLHEVQLEIDSVKNIMTDNMNKVIERHDNLDSLQEKSDSLTASSKLFQNNARQLKWKFCRDNAKNICIITIIIAIIIFIVVMIITRT